MARTNRARITDVFPINNTCLKCIHVHRIYMPSSKGRKYKSQIQCKAGYMPRKDCEHLTEAKLCSGCDCGIGGERTYDSTAERGSLLLCPVCLEGYIRRGNYLYCGTHFYYGEVTHDILYNGKRYSLTTEEATKLILNAPEYTIYPSVDKKNELEALRLGTITEEKEQHRRQSGLKDGDRADRFTRLK